MVVVYHNHVPRGIPAMRTKSYRAHDACKMVPSMSAETFAELKSDIEKNGLLEPIWLLDNKILDGLHRYKACKELGIAPSFRQYEGPLDPQTFVVAQNISRRHLSRNQKNWFIKRTLVLHPDKSDRAIARMVGAHNATVARVRAENSTDQIDQLPKRIGRDGKARKAPPVVHRASSLISHVDFECRKLLKFISTLHPSEITDAQDFIMQLENQLARLKDDLPRAQEG
jgi:hypothetical protein